MSSLSKPTIIFHWLIAICFIGVFIFGMYVADLPKSPDKFALMGVHKSMGLAVLILAALRIYWRFKEGWFAPVAQLANWQQKASKAVHYLLLIATLLMPISGLVMNIAGGRATVFFGFELIGEGEKIAWLSSFAHSVHVNSIYLIMFIFIVHLFAAIKHHFFDKDATLTRMLGIKQK